ncbi:MAG: hypothetical protein A3F18_00085 [Legionellales bacterium RIFCSPHIGHO2_12_FULL_37_14]|nr:MAG: hypothetical protein A3F18_00085 [Legionellales bacterium RIFCSPHIGHO2_12_FULL_37_14]
MSKYRAAFLKAEEYFHTNPQYVKLGRRESGLQNSYINTKDGQLIRLLSQKNPADAATHDKILLGEGKFARVKLGETIDGKLIAVKISSLINIEFRSYAEFLEKQKRIQALLFKEGVISRKVGLAQSKLTIRKPETTQLDSELPEFDSETLCGEYDSMQKKARELKYYQAQELYKEELYKIQMHNYSFGLLSFYESVDLSIQLLLLTTDLHAGRYCKDNTPIVHLDIKLENLMLDEYTRLKLVDFGFANYNIDENLRKQGERLAGTPTYVPNEIIKDKDAKLDFTRLDADIFATMRTIYNPYQGMKLSIFMQKQFDQLPPMIKNIINTTYEKEWVLYSGSKKGVPNKEEAALLALILYKHLLDLYKGNIKKANITFTDEYYAFLQEKAKQEKFIQAFRTKLKAKEKLKVAVKKPSPPITERRIYYQSDIEHLGMTATQLTFFNMQSKSINHEAPQFPSVQKSA